MQPLLAQYLPLTLASKGMVRVTCATHVTIGRVGYDV